ncbi:hypothetical protein [Bacillus sp. AFS017336]|uniref:hypothetical protein n=1 Tax=Bacillus sp. AFS017336 TaxID=2033489 RepID=UPI000BEF211A|nr:hypothetical protein [Bacillus sp. AFS017336]PEL14236.1 hypothetical protein CN601_01440 [Bacillus sp. AFS017336]
MSLTLFLLMGLIGVIIIQFKKDQLSVIIDENQKLVIKLKNSSWFQNYWKAGFFLFVMNAALFFITLLIHFILGFLIIPFMHLLVMVLAVVGSFLLWMIVNKAYQGTNGNRLKMSIIGSSFYAVLSFLFIYWLVTLKPSYEGEDLIMSSIGLLMGIIVSVVAFISCLITTGFTFKRKLK